MVLTPCKYLETVAADTPAIRATSWIDGLSLLHIVMRFHPKIVSL
jgi:hypothetical protein